MLWTFWGVPLRWAKRQVLYPRGVAFRCSPAPSTGFAGLSSATALLQSLPVDSRNRLLAGRGQICWQSANSQIGGRMRPDTSQVDFVS